mmetsp:Transcript_2985/g.9830  ORF Transcript_2985/g.9830 Transcript_2985/m.9830 type:complete len:209 (+) Transcript_2985:299-925(+)
MCWPASKSSPLRAAPEGRTRSRIPPVAAQTRGVPAARNSSPTSPDGSQREGMTPKSAAAETNAPSSKYELGSDAQKLAGKLARSCAICAAQRRAYGLAGSAHPQTSTCTLPAVARTRGPTQSRRRWTPFCGARRPRKTNIGGSSPPPAPPPPPPPPPPLPPPPARSASCPHRCRRRRRAGACPDGAAAHEAPEWRSSRWRSAAPQLPR